MTHCHDREPCRARRELAETVRCPHCHQPAGAPCVLGYRDIGYRVKHSPHLLRFKLALATSPPRQT